MRGAFLRFTALTMLLAGGRVGAQSDGDAAAYFALTLTPPGAFAPLATVGRLGEPTSSTLSLRYGRLSYDGDDAIHSVGVGGDFRAGSGVLGVTGGAVVCSGCDALIMIGVDWTTPLVRRTAADGAYGIGLTTAAGAALPTSDESDGFLLSGSIGVPFSMVAGKPDGLRVIPFITPAIGVGSVVTDDGATGLRPILGGGIGIVAANGFGVSAGVQKVFIEGGEAVLGITLTLGGR